MESYKSIKKCEVCDELITLIFEEGVCPHCDWHNGLSFMLKIDNTVTQNLISLTTARKRYTKNKSWKPNFKEIINALLDYKEINFSFKNIYYIIDIVYDINGALKIRLYNSKTKKNELFDNSEDFIKNAKVDDILLKDICWDNSFKFVNNIYDKKVKTETKCAVCDNYYFADFYGQGECGYCGWRNDKYAL